jgi:hypothetical protein
MDYFKDLSSMEGVKGADDYTTLRMSSPSRSPQSVTEPMKELQEGNGAQVILTLGLIHQHIKQVSDLQQDQPDHPGSLDLSVLPEEGQRDSALARGNAQGNLIVFFM